MGRGSLRFKLYKYFFQTQWVYRVLGFRVLGFRAYIFEFRVYRVYCRVSGFTGFLLRDLI